MATIHEIIIDDLVLEVDITEQTIVHESYGPVMNAYAGGGGGTGDMLKATYDTDNDGVVEAADTLTGLTATISELNYTDGVTSNIQIQLDAKLAAATYTASDVLNKLLGVDGAGTGLDADLLDGLHASSFLLASNKTGADTGIVSGTAGTENYFSKWNADGDLVGSQVIENRVINSLNMGLVEGGEVTINADPTKFDISAGNGVIIDNFTDPNNPTVTEVSWSAKTAVAATYLASATVSYVLIDSSGNVVQLNTYPTEEDHRDYIFLAQLGHTNLTSIATVLNAPEVATSSGDSLRDFQEAVGVINDSIIVTANGANLNIDVSAGKLRYPGINFHTNNKIPDTLTLSSATGVSVRHRTQTGNGSTSTTIDVGNYDVGGTITALSGTKYTNMRIFRGISGNVVVQYGQTEYANMAAAISGLQTESFVIFPNLKKYFCLIGILTVRNTATDLSDTSQARFSRVSKFGEVNGAAAGVSVSSLQNAYNNSITPEITTDSTLGAVTIKRGSAADTDDVIEILNGSGTQVAKITGEGKALLQNIELGHASDTTITRVSAGVIAVEGNNVLLSSNIGSVVQAYSAVLDATTASFTTADETKLDLISVTQAVDLDTMESDIATNNAKVSNATHTGEVTGSTTLAVDKTAITNKTLVSAAVGDHVLVADASDADNLKKVTIQTIVDLAGGTYNDEQAQDAVGGILADTDDIDLSYDDVTPQITAALKSAAITGKTLVSAAVGDHVLVADASDADNLKKVTIQTIVDLASAGSTTILYTDQTPDNGTYGLLGGTVNGSNTVFTVSQGSYVSGTLYVYLNGQLMTQGASNDFQETTPGSGTFTFITAPPTNSIITAVYQTTTGTPVTYSVSTYTAATVNLTATSGEHIILLDCTSNAITVNLPTAVGNTCKYTFVKIDSGSNQPTIDGNATETINGATTQSIQFQWSSFSIISDNINWIRIA